MAEHRVRVLKNDESFAVFDRYGEAHGWSDGEEGVYSHGTRHLSRSEMFIGRARPLLLSSVISPQNLALTVDLCNPDDDGAGIKRGALHLRKTSFVYKDAFYERVRGTTFASGKRLRLEFRFGADFRDIFEIRGEKRAARGSQREARREGGALTFAYLGLDGVERVTRISHGAEGLPAGKLSDASFAFDLELNGQTFEIYFCSDFASPPSGAAPKARFDLAIGRLREDFQVARARSTAIETTSESLQSWIDRSFSDLQMLLTRKPTGVYPYAGTPWFSAAFGRDGVITALQTLWIDPSIARGTLAYLAANQAQSVAPEQDAEPGKILHEARRGEMASLGEIPFGQYYGSVDSTPLFVVLAGEYAKATGDYEFVESIWENVEAALRWIDEHGDADGDGFVEYARKSSNGLSSQGWKDSFDSIFHADGSAAEPPVALCEVQGYVYLAKLNASYLAERGGRPEIAARLADEASRLKRAFNADFWCPDIGAYALALDGDKRKCCVRASNMGHALFCGIVDDERAADVARAMMGPASFSGWGVRTLFEGEARYNPMSYHNGSVWPHDTSIFAMGLARYGFREEACALFSGMMAAARGLELERLPELFCGFARPEGGAPVLYPQSCAPQAWAAGAAFMMLQACLGLRMDFDTKQIIFDRPRLPDGVASLRLTGLRLGDCGSVDVELERAGDGIGVRALRKSGSAQVAFLS